MKVIYFCLDLCIEVINNLVWDVTLLLVNINMQMASCQVSQVYGDLKMCIKMI